MIHLVLLPYPAQPISPAVVIGFIRWVFDTAKKTDIRKVKLL